MSVTENARKGEYRTGPRGRRYFHYYPRVVERYRGYAVLFDPNDGAYYVGGLPADGGPADGPATRRKHRTGLSQPGLSGAIAQIDEIIAYREWLADGYSPAQWHARQRRRGLLEERHRLEWSLSVTPQGYLNDTRRERLSDIERQLIPLADAERPAPAADRSHGRREVSS